LRKVFLSDSRLRLEPIEKASEQITKPGILTLPEAEALLRSTSADFVSAIAIGLFAGLRPEAELSHLDWQSIN
jgi:hypothetical protein